MDKKVLCFKWFVRVGIFIMFFVGAPKYFPNTPLQEVNAQSTSESLEIWTDGTWNFCVVNEQQKQVEINGIVKGQESQCIDSNGCLTIPSSIKKGLFQEYTVVGIGVRIRTNEDGTKDYFNAFALMDNFTSVRIPEGVEYIGAQAFYGCAVKSVILPESLHSIKEAAFWQCEQLKNIQLPENLETLGESCFRESGLISVVIPNKVKVIPKNAFRSCTALKSIVLPEKLEELGMGALPENQGLVITIPEKLTDIGQLHLIDLSGVIFNVVAGGDVAIYLTENNITYNTYPSSEKKPDEEEKKTEAPTEEEKKTEAPAEKPTEEEKKTEAATEKPTEEKIKKGKTYTAGSLNYKVLSDKQVSFAGSKKKTVKTLTIPATVRINNKTFKVVQIEKGACKGWKKLQSVTVGKNVSTIKDEAFMNCKALKTIVFGTETKTIGKKVLKGDKKLTKVQFKGKKLKKIGKGTFAGVSFKKIKFVVPKSKNSKYKKQYAKLIKKAK